MPTATRQIICHGQDVQDLARLLGVDELPGWARTELEKATVAHHRRLHGRIPTDVLRSIPSKDPSRNGGDQEFQKGDRVCVRVDGETKGGVHDGGWQNGRVRVVVDDDDKQYRVFKPDELMDPWVWDS